MGLEHVTDTVATPSLVGQASSSHVGTSGGVAIEAYSFDGDVADDDEDVADDDDDIVLQEDDEDADEEEDSFEDS